MNYFDYACQITREEAALVHAEVAIKKARGGDDERERFAEEARRERAEARRDYLDNPARGPL